MYIKRWSSGRVLTCLRNVGQLSDKKPEAIWVHGVYYAPASVIRRANRGLRKDRYIFQKVYSDDWEPCPQYKAALGKCPELVRVE
jgi:hypothetical protein